MGNANDQLHLSNMDDRCIRCLCKAATQCNLTLGCTEGYCGPFKVSKIYWTDAGKQTLPDDDVARSGGKNCTFYAYLRCT